MNPENNGGMGGGGAPSQNPGASTSGGSQNRTLMGVLSYIGPLVLIPFFMGAKSDPFVKFHMRQGFVMFVIEILAMLLFRMVPMVWIISPLVNLATLILSIIGIVNVVHGKEKEIPVVGGFAKHVTFV
jgi:uncharacterized membrane protein